MRNQEVTKMYKAVMKHWAADVEININILNKTEFTKKA